MPMDLFSSSFSGYLPLAESLRPKSFTDLYVSTHLKSKLPQLIKKIETGVLNNLIFWGPPGSGKTSLAMLLSKKAKGQFIHINAIDTGAKKIREIGQSAKKNKIEFNQPTVVFIDEIHRLNKAQQDVLLPYTEKGDFVLIGATTENPSYELNSALLSRCQVLTFAEVTAKNITTLIEKGFKQKCLTVSSCLDEASILSLIELSSGDARQCLNLVEQVSDYAHENPTELPISLNQLSELLNKPLLKYDKASDEHYNCISAFIKSIRGGDADAGLYYLARMLKGGEDPKFIARRLIISASEDVGNADPRALTIATSGMAAVIAVGLPEAAINLAQVVTYLASAPKSNRSYLGFKKAQAEVNQSNSLPVPNHLKTSQTKFNQQQGFGKDYKYTHDYPKGWAAQNYLPEKIKDLKFYQPSNLGFEKNITEYAQWKKK